MSASICLLLETRPNLDDLRHTLSRLGLSYKHSLPPDDHSPYPIHVFGCVDLRLVYYAGDPLQDEALIESQAIQASYAAEVRLRLLISTLARRYAGSIIEPDDALDYDEAHDYAELSA
jgi:hypothetical protein